MESGVGCRWIKDPPYFDEASFTGGRSLEFTADRFKRYQYENVTLDQLCESISDLTRETLEPERWPINVRQCSIVDSTCKVAGKIHSVTTGYTRGGELAKRAAYVDSGTTEFISTIKLIAFRTENMMIRILSERIADYESADSILRDIFKGLADLVPNLEQRTLAIWLRPLAVRRHNEALRHLCTALNATGTLFPGTDLRLIYDITGPA